MALAPEDVRPSLWTFGRRGFGRLFSWRGGGRLFGWRGAGRLFSWLGVGRLWRRLFWNGLHRHPRLDQFQSGRNHLLAFLQSALHDAFALEHRSGLNIAALECVVRLDHKDELHSLLRADHLIGNERSPIWRGARYPHPHEEARGDKIRIPIF